MKQERQRDLATHDRMSETATGSRIERIRLTAALLTLAASGPVGQAIYSSFSNAGVRVQFGGGGRFLSILGNLVRRPGYSIGWHKVIYLDPRLANEPAEIIAVYIAHKAYHARQPILRYPFRRTEEVGAFAQQAAAWEELRIGYEGHHDNYFKRLEDVLTASRTSIADYVKGLPIYS